MTRTDGVETEKAERALPSKPRALIHKKILEAAAESPDTSIESLSDEISGASVELVERVLDEYGDPGSGTDGPSDGGANADSPADAGPSPGPAGDHDPDPTADGGATAAPTADSASADEQLLTDGAPTDPADGDASTGADAAVDRDETASRDTAATEEAGGAGSLGSTTGTGDTGDAPLDDTGGTGDSKGPTDAPAPAALTERQLAVLRAVAERPTATQRELADQLGVSRATVSKRVNGIEGFDWGDRAAFVDRLFDDSEVAPETGTDGSVSGVETRSAESGALAARVDDLEASVAALEARVDASDDGAVDDPELLRKAVHACMEADYVSQSEELRILRALLPVEG